jgi:large subunit ribosomal protein L24
MSEKLHIRRGDTVLVLSGNSRGKKGKVLEVYPVKRKAIVEGINMVTKHLKPSAAHPNGGIEKQEAPIHISNLMIVDPSSGDPTRIGRKLNKDGKLQRYSKKTGEFIKDE